MMLNCNIEKNRLIELLTRQLSNFFFISENETEILWKEFDQVWLRLYTCIKLVNNKYFIIDGVPAFNPYHSGQYLIYLYFYSNTCSNNKEKQLADKIYYLNKIMHSCDIYHEVNLPESFFLEHPVGTVLGRAQYGNRFFAMQNCTIGGNKGCYPIIGNNVKMYSGSKILGNSVIGDNVSLAANTYVKDMNIPDNVTVFGASPHLIIKYL